MKRILQSMIGIIVVSLSACGTIESPSRSNANLTVTPSPAPTTVAYPAPPPVQPPSPAPTESARNQRPVIIPPCEFDATAAMSALSGRTLESWQFSEPETMVQDEGLVIAQWLPDNQRILYIKNEEALQSIHTIDTKTKVVNNYASSQSMNVPPFWSEAAKGILYPDKNASGTTSVLKFQQTSTASVHEVVQNINGSPQYSPSGRRILLNNYDHTHLTVMNHQTKGYEHAAEQDQLVDRINSLERKQRPTQWAWSPDETHTLLYGIQGQYLVDFANNTLCGLKLPQERGQSKVWIYNAQWSPDGRQIAFLITEGSDAYLVPYLKLVIFDTITGQVKDFSLSRGDIMDVKWLDTQFLILEISIPNAKYALNTLAILDSITGITKDILPNHEFASNQFRNDMLLSPNRQRLLVESFDEPTNQICIQVIEIK